MGTLTAIELEDEVRAALAGRTNLDHRLRRILNLAQQRLARKHDFDEMENISESILVISDSEQDRFLQLPTLRECYSIVLLDNASGTIGSRNRKLVGQTAQWMDRWQSRPDYWVRNIPHSYCVWGNRIELFPIYDAVYTLRMRWTQWPNDLVEDTDTSDFLQKDEILIELALAYAYRSLGKEDDAMKHEGWANSLIKDASENDREKPDISHRPSISDADAVGASGIVEPWNDPFDKG